MAVDSFAKDRGTLLVFYRASNESSRAPTFRTCAGKCPWRTPVETPRVYRDRSTRSDDRELRQRLRELAAERWRFGVSAAAHFVGEGRRRGEPQEAPPAYKEERLAVRKRRGRKRELGTRAPMTIRQGANQRW